METETTLEARLAPLLQRIFRLARPPHLSRSPTGKFNSTWFVDCGADDSPFVVRVAPPDDRSSMLFYEHRMMRQEPAIHARLRAETSMPVPEVLHFEAENDILGRDFIVMERMPGAPIEIGDEAVMETLGRKLREVHEVVRSESGKYGYLGEHRPMEPQATWSQAFLVMWNALLDDIVRCAGAPVEEIQRWRDALETRIGVFDHFTEPASLLHMDVWAENILVDERGRLSALVDWDRALWGDPEIEFAVLDYCGISTPGFWRGYGAARPTGREAEVRRTFYLAYEVLKYIVIRIARQGDRIRAEDYRRMGDRLLSAVS